MRSIWYGGNRDRWEIVVASYLSAVTMVLIYFGFADLGADDRERRPSR